MTATPLRPLALVGRSFRLAWEGFGLLFPLVLTPSLALSALAYAIGPDPFMAEAQAQTGLAAFASIALELVGGPAITGVACLAALDVALGKRHSMGEYVSQTLRHIGPLILLGLLLSVATTLGVAALIVPGLYIAGRFLPWTPAVVFENAGWSGLGRAQELTEGYRWPLAGAVLAMGILCALGFAALLPVVALAQGSFAIAILVDATFSTLVYLLGAAFVAAAYLRLREIREGVGLAEVAASLD